MHLLKSLLLACLGTVTLCQAQTTRQELSAVKERTAGNYYAYPTPTGKLTAAPEGYKPFYISHYGRHGSRYMIDDVDPKEVRDVLRSAEQDGVLTKLGKETIKHLDVFIETMDGRNSELTPVGHAQHKGIANRMFKAYPEVFNGHTKIDARSTPVHRTILSMGAFCQELKSLNGDLDITNDASEHDMFFMCNKNHAESHKTSDAEVAWKKAYDAFNDANYHSDRFMNSLFTKKGYLPVGKANKFMRQMFNVACDVQDMTDMGFSLYPLFNDDELFDFWQSQNAYWYGSIGLSPIQDGDGPEIAANLLRNIIDNAQNAIGSDQPSVTLRFGHDTGILPLLALMRVGGAYCKVADLKELYKSWADYKLIPMAANLQLVFYRNSKGNVLVKALLNEEETTLPAKAFSGPYYQWNDVLDYYEEMLSHIRNVKPSVTIYKH